MNLDKSKECQNPGQHILAVPSKADPTHAWAVSCIQRSVPVEGFRPRRWELCRIGFTLTSLATALHKQQAPAWAAIWNVISLFLECIGLGCKINSLDGTRRWWQHAFAPLQMCALINICVSLSKLEGLYICTLDWDFGVLRLSQKILSLLMLQIPKCLKGSLTFYVSQA